MRTRNEAAVLKNLWSSPGGLESAEFNKIQTKETYFDGGRLKQVL